MRLAILFSGQGHQQPEHLLRLRAEAAPELQAALAETIPSVWAVEPIRPEELQANRMAQPLIFALELDLWRRLQPGLPRPVCAAGYSLGEMAACGAAGAFTAAAGVALCARRAEVMDGCVDVPSGLLAVLGLRAPAIEAMARACGLFLAIRNGPDHFVLGGAHPGLDRAEALAEAGGAQRIVRLAVNTPSHTPLLAAAEPQFAVCLEPHRTGRLAFPVLSALDGRPLRTGPEAMDALARQLCTPLDWEACLGAVLEMQPTAVLELGPGNALARMWTERETGVPVRAADEFRSLAGILDWVRSQG